MSMIKKRVSAVLALVLLLTSVSVTLAVLLLASAGACAQNKMSDVNAVVATATVAPTEQAAATPTAVSDSTIPQDPSLDAACRQTIIKFFNSIPGDERNPEDLIVPPKYYLLDPRADVTRTLVQLISGDEWWHEHFPGKALDGYMKPIDPNEYVYFVEFTVDDGGTPSPYRPKSFGALVWVVNTEKHVCMVRDWGW